MNIPDVWHGFKGRLANVPEDIFLVLIVILVGVSSFGLGRISAFESRKEPVRIISATGNDLRSLTEPKILDSVQKVVPSSAASARGAGKQQDQNGKTSAEVVASKNSNKYHLPWCGGAKRISEANKIVFASKMEAEKAGYVPAANCPGL